MTQDARLLAALDTAGDLAGVAICEAGVLLAETTWRTRQNHSRELLPALDWLLRRLSRGKDHLAAIAVCLGPGSYAGLRVGLSTAKTLAFALDIPIAGVGRLEADAWAFSGLAQERIVAVQAAGRAELAWAAYTGRRVNGQTGLMMDEVQGPRLGSAGELLEALKRDDLVCGELRTLPEGLLEGMVAKGASVVEVSASRVLGVAALAQQRLDRGDVDNADALVPLYLRAPAIGPQS
jgi:tRNA threonylcarbamoyl adenosine modification protein YeaZ